MLFESENVFGVSSETLKSWERRSTSNNKKFFGGVYYAVSEKL